MRMVFAAAVLLVLAVVLVLVEYPGTQPHNCHAIENVVGNQVGKQLGFSEVAPVNGFSSRCSLTAQDGSHVEASYKLVPLAAGPSYIMAHYLIANQGRMESIDRVLPVLNKRPVNWARVNVTPMLSAVAYQPYDFFTCFTP